MSTQPLTAHYRRRRGALLEAATRHRRAETPAGIAPDIHQSHLAVCRRQLGALRQAWRRSLEARRTPDPRGRARRPASED